MARKPTQTVVDSEATVIAVPDVIEVAAQAHDVMRSNLESLAAQFGYEGSLTVGALEDEIRFYQRRSVEAVLALGTRLLLLKEQVAHGEFIQRVELLDINQRMARRFMSATLKFGKSDTKSVLSAAGNQTKLLELVVLDDEEIAELADGGSAANLTLDEIARMTVTELRAALREARENEAAMGRVLQEKNAKIDELAVDSRKRKSAVKDAEWPETIDGLKDDAHGLGKILDEVLAKHLTLIQATEVVYDNLPEGSPLFDRYKGVVYRLGEQIERLCTLAAGLRNEYHNRLEGLVALDRSYILPEQDADAPILQ